MGIFLPIIAYAPAEGAGVQGRTVQGKKNANNLASLSAAISWIDTRATQLIKSCGWEYRHLTSAFRSYDGSRITFDDDDVERSALVRILEEYAGEKLCLLVPCKKSFFDARFADVLRPIWDRGEYGHKVQVLSVRCDRAPLSPAAGRPRNGITEHLNYNVLETETYNKSWAQGCKFELDTKISGP